ncbi:hypothetical protein [uncultured Microbacterium sp.]|uniref:hypothetical protein n=1 Tax=uncultured Microbacterium sp. TaxID=191216 RepID=UPI0028DC44B2|nr:hypothetical protein [uncultured Microbacterium sp.]
MIQVRDSDSCSRVRGVGAARPVDRIGAVLLGALLRWREERRVRTQRARANKRMQQNTPSRHPTDPRRASSTASIAGRASETGVDAMGSDAWLRATAELAATTPREGVCSPSWCPPTIAPRRTMSESATAVMIFVINQREVSDAGARYLAGAFILVRL